MEAENESSDAEQMESGRWATDASSTALTEGLECCAIHSISSLPQSILLGFDLRLKIDQARARRDSDSAVEAEDGSEVPCGHDSGPHLTSFIPSSSCSSSTGPHRSSISASMPPFVAPGSTRWYPSDHNWTWTSSALHAFRSAGRSRSLRSRRRHVADATKRFHDHCRNQDRLRRLIDETGSRKRPRPDCDVLGLVPLLSFADDALLIRGGVAPPRKTILKTIAKEHLWNQSRPCSADIFDALAAAL